MTKRRNLRRARRPLTNTAGLSLSYSGPTRLNTYNGQDSRPVKVNLSYSFTIGSDAAGIASNIIRGPGLLSTSDWTSYANVYQEFRVLAMELRYMPFFNGSYDAALVQGSGATDVVHIPLSTPPASLDEVVQHVTWSPFRTSTPFKKTWKMFGVEESTFGNVTNAIAINHGGITFFCDSLTPNIDYGRGVVTYLVEFRGRK